MKYNPLNALWLAIAVTFLGVTRTHAQGEVADSWLQRAGGGLSDFANAMVDDADGNTYITGGYHGVAYFEDRELTARGDADIFIAKYDYAGNLVWAKSVGSDMPSQSQEYGVDIVLAGGYLYVTGIFEKTGNFDNVLVASSGSNDIFLAKYTLQGHLVWVRAAGGVQQDSPSAVAADDLGNVYLTGLAQGEAQFGTYTIDTKGPGFFLAKYNADGDVRWVQHSVGSAEGKDVIVKSGHCFVVGNTDGITRFSATTLKAWQPSIFLNEYTLDGKLVSAKLLAGALRISVESFQFGSRGLYVGGYFNEALQVAGTSRKSAGSADAFLMRVDPEGIPQWVKTMGGPQADMIRKVTVSNDRQIVVGGEFNDYILMDSTRIPGGNGRDLFIASYSEQGLFNGADCLAGKAQILLKDMIVQADRITLTGSFSGNVLYGANSLSPVGMSDVLMAGLALQPVDDHTSPSSDHVAFYPSPSYSEITVESTDPLDVVQILDMTGNVLVKKTLEGEYKAQIAIKTLPPGHYVIWTSSKVKIKSAKFDLTIATNPFNVVLTKQGRCLHRHFVFVYIVT
jgi:hypothetical protein